MSGTKPLTVTCRYNGSVDKLLDEYLMTIARKDPAKNLVLKTELGRLRPVRTLTFVCDSEEQQEALLAAFWPIAGLEVFKNQKVDQSWTANSRSSTNS
jgi:hypothetical protein